MKRADGHAMLVGGDRDQVVAQIADLYIARRDMLLASGSKRGITVSAPTNEDVAEISQAIRQRLKARGEIAGDEAIHRAIDQRRPDIRSALSPPAIGCGSSGAPGARSTAASSRSATMATSWRCLDKASRGFGYGPRAVKCSQLKHQLARALKPARAAAYLS